MDKAGLLLSAAVSRDGASTQCIQLILPAAPFELHKQDVRA
jgi:hypothetical protein